MPGGIHRVTSNRPAKKRGAGKPSGKNNGKKANGTKPAGKTNRRQMSGVVVLALLTTVTFGTIFGTYTMLRLSGDTSALGTTVQTVAGLAVIGQMVGVLHSRIVRRLAGESAQPTSTDGSV